MSATPVELSDQQICRAIRKKGAGDVSVVHMDDKMYILIWRARKRIHVEVGGLMRKHHKDKIVVILKNLNVNHRGSCNAHVRELGDRSFKRGTIKVTSRLLGR